jgi:DNA-binding NarL/FixJ family response regulator
MVKKTRQKIAQHAAKGETPYAIAKALKISEKSGHRIAI